MHNQTLIFIPGETFLGPESQYGLIGDKNVLMDWNHRRSEFRTDALAQVANIMKGCRIMAMIYVNTHQPLDAFEIKIIDGETDIKRVATPEVITSQVHEICGRGMAA